MHGVSFGHHLPQALDLPVLGLIRVHPISSGHTISLDEVWKVLEKVKLKNNRPSKAGVVKHVLNREAPPHNQVFFGQSILPRQAAQGGKTFHAQMPMTAKLAILVLELLSKFSSKNDKRIGLTCISPKFNTTFAFEPSLSHSTQLQLALSPLSPIGSVVHSQPGLRRASESR